MYIYYSTKRYSFIILLISAGFFLLLSFFVHAFSVSGQTYDISDAPITDEEWAEIEEMESSERAARIKEITEQYGREMSQEEVEAMEDRRTQEERERAQSLAEERPQEYKVILEKELAVNDAITSLEKVFEDMAIWNTALFERFNNIIGRIESRIEKLEEESGSRFLSSRSYLQAVYVSMEEFERSLDFFVEVSSEEITPFDVLSRTKLETFQEDIELYYYARERLYRESNQVKSVLKKTIQSVIHDRDVFQLR